jgi:hypothetical protein
MRVIVEVASGSASGRQKVLKADQLLDVGSTDWADFAIRDDPRMSRRHFRIETDLSGCHVEDLGSSNGTFVNRVRITGRTALRDGDEVLAGATTFVVRIQGEASHGGYSPIAATGASAWPAHAVDREPAAKSFEPGWPQREIAPPAATRPAAPDPQPERQVVYAVESLGSGLTVCRGSVDQIAPTDLAILLCQYLPVHLIVDFRKLGGEPPAGMQSPQYLFDWLDPAAAAAVSPVLVSQEDLLTWPSLIEQGWEKDAVVCVFSKQEKGAMLDHFRRVCRANPHSAGDAGGILGCCWPSLLGSLLSHFTASFVRDWMAGIDAVLIESLDPPRTWQIYGSGQITQMLDQLGFRRQEA